MTETKRVITIKDLDELIPSLDKITSLTVDKNENELILRGIMRITFYIDRESGENQLVEKSDVQEYFNIKIKFVTLNKPIGESIVFKKGDRPALTPASNSVTFYNNLIPNPRKLAMISWLRKEEDIMVYLITPEDRTIVLSRDLKED